MTPANATAPSRVQAVLLHERRLGHTDRARNSCRHELRRGHATQIDEGNPVRVLRRDLTRSFDGKSRFADAAWTRQREQTTGGKQAPHLGNVMFATDERGRIELGTLPGARAIRATLGGLTQTWRLEEPARSAAAAPPRVRSQSRSASQPTKAAATRKPNR